MDERAATLILRSGGRGRSPGEAMAIFLLVRAVSDRFVDAAKGDPDLAFSLLDKGLPPPEWHVNAIRDHERRRDGLAKAGISFDADAAELHDLDRAWDGLKRTLETLGADDANIFVVGTEVGEDEEAGIRVLTSIETSTSLTTLERIDRAGSKTQFAKFSWHRGAWVNSVEIHSPGRW